MGADVRFPHLGIVIDSLGKTINIGNFSIAYYGIVIALGMVAGFFMASWQATRLGQDKDIYLDLALWDIIFAIIGARLYYVIFSWDYYGKHPMEILNTRGGGMAIYGGVIAGVLTTFIFAKVKKLSFFDLTDAACGGLLVGQIFGRWGNFFNREAFGDYTNNLFAMQLPVSAVRANEITQKMWDHVVTVNGVEYIQVHPTFLYESLWNVGVLLFLFWFRKRKKFNGEVFLMYLIGYGLGRIWIEGLRTDQLLLPVVGLPVSQLLSGCLVVGCTILVVWKRKKLSSGGETAHS